MSYLPMCSCLAIFSMHSSHCIPFHYLFAAAHYCETHRIHLITYTCSFCLCPTHLRTHPRHSSAATFVCHAPPFPFSLVSRLSGCFVSFLCLSFLFFYLLIHTIRQLDICRLIIIGYCSRHRLIDSSFLLVSCTLVSVGPFSALLCST